MSLEATCTRVQVYDGVAAIMFAGQHALKFHLAGCRLKLCKSGLRLDEPFLFALGRHLEEDIDILKACRQALKDFDATIDPGALAQNLLRSLLVLPEVITR